MSKRKSAKRCELCNRPMNPTALFTICDGCDSKLEVRFQKQDNRAAIAWAKKWRCKECGQGLTPDRARLCHNCQPCDTRETEDRFDSIPSYTSDLEDDVSHA